MSRYKFKYLRETEQFEVYDSEFGESLILSRRMLRDVDYIAKALQKFFDERE